MHPRKTTTFAPAATATAPTRRDIFARDVRARVTYPKYHISKHLKPAKTCPLVVYYECMEHIHLQEAQYLAGEREAEMQELRNDPEFHAWLDMLDAQPREQ
jgi:hypothetical protein